MTSSHHPLSNLSKTQILSYLSLISESTIPLIVLSHKMKFRLCILWSLSNSWVSSFTVQSPLFPTTNPVLFSHNEQLTFFLEYVMLFQLSASLLTLCVPSSQNTLLSSCKSTFEHLPFSMLNPGLTSSLKSFLDFIPHPPQWKWLYFLLVPLMNLRSHL